MRDLHQDYWNLDRYLDILYAAARDWKTIEDMFKWQADNLAHINVLNSQYKDFMAYHNDNLEILQKLKGWTIKM